MVLTFCNMRKIAMFPLVCIEGKIMDEKKNDTEPERFKSGSGVIV